MRGRSLHACCESRRNWGRLIWYTIVPSKMSWQRAVAHVAVIIWVALHTIHWCHIRIWRSRKVSSRWRCWHWRSIIWIWLSIGTLSAGSVISWTSSKSSSSCSSSLFNGSCVMILMACQSSSSCESLLTICIWALVWTLSRMDTSVSSKRAGITERLFNVSVKHTNSSRQ